jgi:hypothetical protein
MIGIHIIYIYIYIYTDNICKRKDIIYIYIFRV